MNRLVSPKLLADAIGVSESSLKRWVDAGKIRAVRTEGGHRRILVSEAIRFIRERQQPLLHPELLGLPASATTPADTVQDVDALQRFLEQGDARQARALVLTRFMEGESVAALCDGPVRAALERVGDLWRHEDAGIFIEHRASDLCLQLLGQLRALLDPGPGAPVALGGAPSGDAHMLPTVMASTVLASEEFDAVNLGAETPVAALSAAIAEHDPQLLWLSVTMPPSGEVTAGLARLFAAELARGRAVVVGGRHAERVAGRTAGVTVATSMRELAAFARGLRRASV